MSLRFSVIPAKAGIQYFQAVTNDLDPDFRRSDDYLRTHQFSIQFGDFSKR
jgi:hypothetical protein